MNEILLTYIVPVYNTGAYLLRCLQSIDEQGLDPQDYEVIVVNDGSTDNSEALILEFAKSHLQFRLLNQRNAGVSAARNLALDQARGRYIGFVDSDDFLEPGLVPSLLRRAVDEALDVLVFNSARVDSNGKVLDCDQEKDTPCVMTGAQYLESYKMTPYIWRFFIRRDYLNDRQLRFNPDLIVCEDGALIAEFLLHADRVAHDSASPYRYVSRGDSAMNNDDAQHLRRRIFSQVDAAALIDATARRYEAAVGNPAPASVFALRNVYLYFSMTKALVCGCVDDVVNRIREAGLFPFPCVEPVAGYEGAKWGVIHRLMMHPRLWAMLSKVYRLIKK